MPRFVAQHSTNDRALAYEDAGTPILPRLQVKGDGGTLTDTYNDATGVGVLMAKFGGGKLEGRVNGHKTVPASLNDTETGPANGRLTIGASGDNTPLNYIKGQLRHLIITQGLTMHEIMQLEAWLLWDVGRADLLPGDHPYKNTRP